MPKKSKKNTTRGTQRRKNLSFYDEISRPYNEKPYRTNRRQISTSSISKNKRNKKSSSLSSESTARKTSSKLIKFYLVAGVFLVFCILFTIATSRCSANISKQDIEINENMQQIESELKANIASYSKTIDQNVVKEAETQSYPKVLSTISDLPHSDNSINYSGSKQPSQENKSKLENEVKNIVENDDVGLSFCMIDFFTQNCIYYNIDQQRKTFSSIKGPFLSADACQIDDFVNIHKEDLYQAIKNSENEPYEMLWNQYGTSYMQNWLNELKIDDSLEGIEYPEHFKVRSMAKLWAKMFQEFNHNDSIASFVADFVHTKNSAIDWELGGEYLVQTKAGWGDGTEDYTGLNDCGIVNSDQHPYILCIFSGYGENPAKLQNLVRCLDNCHKDLV